MNPNDLIDIKEKLAIGRPLTVGERDFVLDCINEATGLTLMVGTISEEIARARDDLQHCAPNYGSALERFALRLQKEWQGANAALAPPNYLGRIEHIWAFLSLDDGGEGICAAPLVPGMMTVPMIAADKNRLDSLKPMARKLASIFQKPIRLAKFTTREDVEIYQP